MKTVCDIGTIEGTGADMRMKFRRQIIKNYLTAIFKLKIQVYKISRILS